MTDKLLHDDNGNDGLIVQPPSPDIECGAISESLPHDSQGSAVQTRPSTTSTMAATSSHGKGIQLGSVVQIFASGVEPDYSSPWSMGESRSWTGSGFCISQRRIVTNCHCVANNTILRIQRQDHPRKWRARVVAVAHDLDLAICKIVDAADDDEFWKDAVTADLAPADTALELYSEVNCIGFPKGGSTLCLTKGVVSRFDAHVSTYAVSKGIQNWTKNSPGAIFFVQVDSAINKGNSGGPAGEF